VRTIRERSSYRARCEFLDDRLRLEPLEDRIALSHGPLPVSSDAMLGQMAIVQPDRIAWVAADSDANFVLPINAAAPSAMGSSALVISDQGGDAYRSPDGGFQFVAFQSSGRMSRDESGYASAMNASRNAPNIAPVLSPLNGFGAAPSNGAGHIALVVTLESNNDAEVYWVLGAPPSAASASSAPRTHADNTPSPLDHAEEIAAFNQSVPQARLAGPTAQPGPAPGMPRGLAMFSDFALAVSTTGAAPTVGSIVPLNPPHATHGADALPAHSSAALTLAEPAGVGRVESVEAAVENSEDATAPESAGSRRSSGTRAVSAGMAAPAKPFSMSAQEWMAEVEVARASLMAGLSLNVAAVDQALEVVMGEVDRLSEELVGWLDDVEVAPWTAATATAAAAGVGAHLYLRRRGRTDESLSEEESSTWLFAQLQTPAGT